MNDKVKELREATRAANEALKDLKAERKACEQFIEEQLENFEKLINKELRLNLDKLAIETNKAIEKTRARIFKRFDQLADILLGEDNKNQPSLTELAEKGRQDGTLPNTRGLREALTEFKKS